MEDFAFISDNHEREMYKSAYDVITRMKMWEYLRDFDPGDNGFMFSRNDENIMNLMNEINKNYKGGHSGFSMGFTMRKMQSIAKYGLVATFKEYFQDLSNSDLPIPTPP